MKSIIHAYQLSTAHPDDVLSGKQTHILLKGYYTFPIYYQSGEVVELLDKNDVKAGHVAIKGIQVLPHDEVDEKDLSSAGFTARDDFLTYQGDELITTIAEVVPVVDECDGNCSCGGNCACKQ